MNQPLKFREFCCCNLSFSFTFLSINCVNISDESNNVLTVIVQHGRWVSQDFCFNCYLWCSWDGDDISVSIFLVISFRSKKVGWNGDCYNASDCRLFDSVYDIYDGCRSFLFQRCNWDDSLVVSNNTSYVFYWGCAT